MEGKQEINIVELLIDIKGDTSSLKTDMSNMKLAQEKDLANIKRDMQDMRSDFNAALKNTEDRLNARYIQLQSVQSSLVGDVDTLKADVGNLKNKEEKEDAEKWRTFVKYMLTALGGMLVIKLPEIISFIIKLFASNKIGGAA